MSALPERFSEDAIARWLKSFTVLFLLGVVAVASSAPHLRFARFGWFPLFKGLLFVAIPAICAATSHLLWAKNVLRGLAMNLALSVSVVAGMWITYWISPHVHGLVGRLAYLCGVYLSVNQILGALVGTLVYVWNPRERWIGALAVVAVLAVVRRVLFF